MTLTLKTTTSNSVLDNLYDTLFGASPVCDIRSGAPAGPDNAAGGTSLAAITAPATAFAAAASKSKAKTGTWSTTGAAAGTAGHYRLRNTGDTVREEGTVTATGGGGDMTLDNVVIAVGQAVTVTAFTRTL
jgi:hypothetical protein